MLWWRALGRSRSNAAKCFCSQVHEPVLAITPTYSHESCYEPHHQFPGPKWSFQTLSVFEITDRRTAPLYSFSPHKRRLWYSSNRYRKYTHFFDIDGVCRGRVFLSLGACCCTPDAQRVYIASKTDVEKGHLMTQQEKNLLTIANFLLANWSISLQPFAVVSNRWFGRTILF